MLTSTFGFLFLLAPFLPMMQATPKPDAPGIAPVVWELVELTDADDVEVAIPDPSRYTVQFLESGRLAAKLDCNQGSADYTASDRIVEITDMRSTLVLCEDDSQAGPFQIILQHVTSFDLDPDGFLLLSGSEGDLRLRAALTGVLWAWREFAGSDGEVLQPDNPDQYTVAFLPEGKLAIQADCNRAIGTYTVDGPAIDLVVGGVTRALCEPESLMDRFLSDLDGVNSHVFRDGHLYLALPLDGGILEFEQRSIDPAKATPVAG